MKKILSIVLLLLTGATAQAATVVFDGGSTTNAIGIDDLVFDGETWDVEFQKGPFPNLRDCVSVGQEPPCDPFLSSDGSTETLASNALNAIVTALNGSTATSVGANSQVQFYVPYSDNPSNPASCKDGPDSGYCVIGASNPISTPGYWDNGGPTLVFPDETALQLARFTQVNAVPVPPAAFLFASGLGLLGCRLKRRRREVCKDAT